MNSVKRVADAIEGDCKRAEKIEVRAGVNDLENADLLRAGMALGFHSWNPGTLPFILSRTIEPTHIGNICPNDEEKRLEGKPTKSASHPHNLLRSAVEGLRCVESDVQSIG